MKAVCSDVGVAGTPYFGMVTLGVHMHKKNHESVAGHRCFMIFGSTLLVKFVSFFKRNSNAISL